MSLLDNLMQHVSLIKYDLFASILIYLFSVNLQGLVYN